MKMKLLSVLTAGAALTIVQAQAQIDTDWLSPYNLLRNGGFNQPTWTSKINHGFATVPYWNNAPTPTASDSGIDMATAPNGDGPDAYSMGSDADVGVWANQDSGYTLQPGDNLYLSLIVGQVNAFGAGWSWAQGALHYQIWDAADGGPGTGAIYDGNFQVGGGVNDQTYHQYYAYIPSSDLTGAVGNDIGISIWNSSDTEGTTAGGSGSWISFDDVYLGTQNVPEPGTIALLTLGGLSALVAIRRRRA
jgi:hypothetical protein